MEITYKTRKIEKVCTIASEAEKKYGSEMAEKIHQRIDEIDASDTVEEMVQFHIIIKVPFHLRRNYDGQRIGQSHSIF